MKSLEELKQIREKALEKIDLRSQDATTRVVVGMATCGISAGARPVLMTLIEEINNRKLNDVVVTQTGCIGVCRLEPLVEIFRKGEEKVTYVNMNPEKIKKVITEHIINGRIVTEYTIGAQDNI